MPAQPRRPVVPSQTEAQSVASDPDETMTAPASSSPAAPAFGPPVEPGEVGRLGPYRIVKELGRGGMGAVYAALDIRLERKLALKVMLPQYAADPVAKARFLREARAAARLKHDNVVTVYEADERDGVPYIAMELLEGYPLDEYLKKKGSPSIQQILRIAAEAAAGLSAAHKIGLVHRDIKPANLWLEAPNGRVKVLDFGLAKPVDTEAELTKSGAVVGTPAYMSPEQARGQKVDHRSDLFSIGAVLYRLCAGKLPFEGPTTMAVLMALGTEEPQPVRELNPDLPESLAALLHQLLAKNAADRPQTADAVVKRLRGISQELAAARAKPTELSTSQPPLIQPQVVYAPMQVTAQPQANPFANIDASGTELVARDPAAPAAPAAAPKPTRQKPAGGWLWPAVGFAALAALVTASVIIIIRNKDGTETKIEVPDGASVTIKGKDGKTLARVGPGKPPAPSADPDRAAAEYALSLGGIVWVNGEERNITAAADLPKEQLTLTMPNLTGTQVTDEGLAHFKDCKSLTNLLLGGTKVTDAGLAHLKDCKSLTLLHLDGTGVTDAGLAHFKDRKSLRNLRLDNTSVTDAGLANFKDCKSLTHLMLGDTKVTDAGLASFKDCNLALLHLQNTVVTDAGLANFRDCKNLVYLNLSNTGVTDAGLAHFKDCKNLMVLNAKMTKVTAKGLEEFHTAVPGCKIDHDGGTIEAKE